MTILAILLSAAIVALGVVGVVSPPRLLELARRFQTQAGVYTATVVRLVLGLALFLAAPTSRAPDALRVIGIVIMVAGLITPMFGLERIRRIFDWWSAQPAGFVRAWAVGATAFGVYLVYALAG